MLMNTSLKSRRDRDKAASQEASTPRLPKDVSMLRRCHGAIHNFAEQLRGELDEAIRNANSRTLGPARHIEAIGRFLLHHQLGKHSAKSAVLAAPTGITIGPDLAVGPKHLDAETLAASVDAWSAIVTALAAYEDKPFQRKPPAIGGRRKIRERGAMTEKDAEAKSLASLEHEAQSLLRLFHATTEKFRRRLVIATAKPKRVKGRNSAMLTPPQVAERLGVSPEKVRGWIEKEKLAATNVARDGSARPRWRIDEKDLEKFEKSRQPTKPRPAQQKRRKKPEAREYF